MIPEDLGLKGWNSIHQLHKSIHANQLVRLGEESFKLGIIQKDNLQSGEKPVDLAGNKPFFMRLQTGNQSWNLW